MTSYTTKDGDTLDYICWRFYGEQSGAVEIVLEANPRLADHGEVFPAGVSIVLPELPEKKKDEGVQLWA